MLFGKCFLGFQYFICLYFIRRERTCLMSVCTNQYTILKVNAIRKLVTYDVFRNLNAK